MDFPSAGYMDVDNNNQSGYARKPLSENTMRALTIKQIRSAEVPQDNVFKVDNAEITQVTFVGIIRNISEQATNYVYTVEDGTGAIEARKWVEQNESPEEADSRRALLVDTYVRVSGKLNSFNNRITFMAHKMRPITDFNEISYHFLEAIRTHLTFTRPSKSSVFTENTLTAGGLASTGNSIHDRVNATIKSFDDTVDGCSVDQICYKLRDMYTETEIRDTLEYLQTEGQCYTTVDSDHFKSCLP